MWLIDAIAEKKIQQAVERGELSNLPGTGKPVPDDDLSMVPEHLRAGYRLLKNAGFLPPELHGAAQLKQAEDPLRRIEDPEARGRAQRQLGLLEPVECVTTTSAARATIAILMGGSYRMCLRLLSNCSTIFATKSNAGTDPCRRLSR